jgi:hypothetical protein
LPRLALDALPLLILVGLLVLVWLPLLALPWLALNALLDIGRSVLLGHWDPHLSESVSRRLAPATQRKHEGTLDHT